MPSKRVPMRMCVGCRQMRPKRELIRVVRSPEGRISLDRTGKASGRGAYICGSAECLDRALRTRALERALGQSVEPEVFKTLRAQIGLYGQ